MSTQITIRPLPVPEHNPSPYQRTQAQAPDLVNNEFFGDFADMLDVINPLQHVPVLSTFYRELTGDTLSAGARVAGGALFGGPFGLFASVISSIVEEQTGGDIGKNLFAAVSGRYEEAGKLG